MNITNAQTAQEWLDTWGTKITRGVLGAAIDGAMSRFRISNANRGRYSVDQICDDREAASILKLGYRRAFDIEYLNPR